MNPRQMNTTALAFMGDAVYEEYIRRHVIESGQRAADRLHAMAVAYVCAGGQARALKELMKGFLSAEETALAKRARNHRTTSKPKNADPVTYKLATALEALIGFLYLDGQTERMEEIIKKVIEILETTGAKK